MGTGKFSSRELLVKALEASGAEIVTVALRRVELGNPQDNLLSAVDPKKYLLLPNTSGARDAKEAVRLARIARAAGGYQPPSPVPDAGFVQLLTALRLFLPDAGLVLSTRETPAFRDRLIPLGITSMSAGSKTDPGGYTQDGQAEAQFQTADGRPPCEVAEVIRKSGYEPVWKDWDAALCA